MFRETEPTIVPEIQHPHPCLPRWRKTVDAAEKRQCFTDVEKAEAGSWDACACGEARQRYGIEYSEVMPTDRILRILGGQFATWVYANVFVNCRAVLNRIEARLGELNY